jgi:hypothetical protein
MRGGREAKGNFRPPEPLEGDAKDQGADDVVFLTFSGYRTVGVVVRGICGRDPRAVVLGNWEDVAETYSRSYIGVAVLFVNMAGAEAQSHGKGERHMATAWACDGPVVCRISSCRLSINA